MKLRAYKSNLSPPWTERRQDEVLARAIPGYPDPKVVEVFSDWPDGPSRQGHQAPMPNRDGKLLREASRQMAEDVYVVSLSVLAPSWGPGPKGERGVARCLELFAARGATVHVVGVMPHLIIPPSDNAALFAQAADEFVSGKLRQKLEKRGQVGGRESAKRKWDAIEERLEPIKKPWHSPKETRTDAELAAIIGVSVNTVKDHLGDRPRKAIKAARKKAERAREAARAAKAGDVS